MFNFWSQAAGRADHAKALFQWGPPGPAQGPLTLRFRADYIAHWGQWQRAPTRHPQQRLEAVRRLCNFLDQGHAAPEERTLDLSGLQLSDLPLLPPDIDVLILDDNCLESLNVSLPLSVREVSAARNGMVTAPESLHEGMVRLVLNDNQIQFFPANLPSTMLDVELANNQLRQRVGPIPLLQGANSYIDLTGNPLSPDTRAALERLIGAMTYEGPAVIF